MRFGFRMLKPDTKERKLETKALEPIPESRSAKQLAQALFAGTDRRLPAEKRRLTKSLKKR